MRVYSMVGAIIVTDKLGFKIMIIFSNRKKLNFSQKIKSKLNQFFVFSQTFVLTIDGLVYSFGYNYNHSLGHEFISNYEKVFIPKLIEGLNNIKSIGINYNNNNLCYSTYFLTNDGFIYFCGNISQNNYQKSPKLIETELKFNDLYSKEGNSVVINENSNEIFELKLNTINKTKFNNIFDFYANIKDRNEKNIGITYKTIE